jgi:hypothetical protein
LNDRIAAARTEGASGVLRELGAADIAEAKARGLAPAIAPAAPAAPEVQR